MIEVCLYCTEYQVSQSYSLVANTAGQPICNIWVSGRRKHAAVLLASLSWRLSWVLSLSALLPAPGLLLLSSVGLLLPPLSVQDQK